MQNLQIVNKVLTLFAAADVTAIKDDDWSERINTAIELQKKTILEKYDWSFALTYRKLNQVAVQEFSKFRFAYQLPVDIARLTSLHSINNDKIGKKLDRQYWGTERDILVADVDGVILRYVMINVDINTQSGEFTDMYAYHIASYLAPSLTESTKLVNFFESKYLQCLNTAMMLDQLNNNSYCRINANENY